MEKSIVSWATYSTGLSSTCLRNFSTHVLCETDEADFVLRDSYADYRVLVLAPDPADPHVVETIPGSLSRVAAPGKHVVNISSGGKMKDTWVLEP